MSEPTQTVKCPECLKGVSLNPEKHKNRKKYCPFCRTVLAKPKLSIMELLKSPFQLAKKVRRAATRERFIRRMRFLKFNDRQISLRLDKNYDE